MRNSPPGGYTLNFVRLEPSRLPEALALMARFYREEALEYREKRARSALEQLLAQPDYGGFWFIEAGGHAAGYFVLTVCYSLEFGGRYALLDEFFVEAESRGAGIGARALARIGEEAARMGLAALRLEVDRFHPRLRAFYARAGFEPHQRDLMTKWLRR